MSVRKAIGPYIQPAERELTAADELASQVHRLLLDTAAKMVDDGGKSGDLLHALDELSTASRLLWKAVEHLTNHRATELWLETQRPVAS